MYILYTTILSWKDLFTKKILRKTSSEDFAL